jgi:hypothetical protein
LINNKINFINGEYDYFSKKEKAYQRYIKYFKNNWENLPFLNFEILSNGIIYNRTNNLVEAFHHKLNNAVGYCHPKLSIVIEKLKILSVQYYHKYVSKLFIEDDDKNNSANIFFDIYNFLTKFLKKTNRNINLNLLLQDTGETKNNLEDITNKIIKPFYNYNINEIEPNKDYSDDVNDVNDNLNDLIDIWWFIEKKNQNGDTDKYNNQKFNDNGFDIDYKPKQKTKKRSYNDMKGNIIQTLYNEEEELNFSKFKQLLKK